MQTLIDNLEKEIAPLMQNNRAFLNLLQENLQGFALGRNKRNTNNFYSFRPYISGEDDIKRLNWKLMAKYQKPFVIETKDEKAFSPCILLDSSASMLTKRNKILQVIYFLLKITDGMGLNLFWGNCHYLKIPPKKKIEKFIISQIASIELKGENNLPNLIYNSQICTNSTLIIITDLLEFNYWSEPLKSLYRKHNLLLIHLSSKLDHKLPQIGYTHIKNPENGKLLLLNCSDSRVQKIYKTRSEAQEQKIYADLKPFLKIWKISADLPFKDSILNLPNF